MCNNKIIINQEEAEAHYSHLHTHSLTIKSNHIQNNLLVVPNLSINTIIQQHAQLRNMPSLYKLLDIWC